MLRDKTKCLACECKLVTSNSHKRMRLIKHILKYNKNLLHVFYNFVLNPWNQELKKTCFKKALNLCPLAVKKQNQ